MPDNKKLAGDMVDLNNIPGLVEPGNLDIASRPLVPNPQTGGMSTEWSFSIGTDRGEVLLPRLINGKIVSQEEAIKHFQKSGEHLGIFQAPDYANAYAVQLHDQQSKRLPSPSK